MSSKTLLHKTKNPMCIIIVKQKGKEVPTQVLKNSARINPHGLGIVWLDTFETTYHKSREWEVLKNDRPYIAHFRYATVGKINKANTHPFPCGKQEHEMLMMNGTIPGLGNEKECDSKVLAKKLGDKPRHTWADELSQHRLVRFITVDTRNKTFQIYNRHLWTEYLGVMYSKDNVLETNVVAVYGTLKRGGGNYYRYLQDSTFIGSGRTADKYPLLIKGLPYMLEEKGVGHNVKVDVFRVSDTVLKKLDALEGHPNWYVRKQIPIKMKGNLTTCWLYFNPMVDRFSNDPMHKEYPINRPHPTATGYGQGRTLFNQYEADKDELLTPYCTGCFSDLTYDELDLCYVCKGCKEVYTSEEVDNLV